MIIKSLVINNFRVFKDVHEIDLAPRRKHEKVSASPIILFGGLNGAGKTSILTAVRVALYGRAAFGRGLNNAEYQAQLDALIHNGSGINDNKASIALTFSHSQSGIESEYTITRSWAKGRKDKIQLESNNPEVGEMTYEQCQSFLNELIPAGIADLFFFDGEKIAELAEDETGEVLQTAVRRLLGIDVVERLRNDLAIYLKRHDISAMPANVQSQIEKLDVQRQNAEREAKQLSNEASLAASRISLLNDDIVKAEAELSSRGGAWASTREQEKAKHLSLDAERKELEKILRSEMEGCLPFALAPNAMNKLLTQLEAEKAAKQAQNFNAELAGFMAQLKSELTCRLTNSETALETIQECLDARSSAQSLSEITLDISDREFSHLQGQINTQAPAAFSRFDKARKRLTEIEEQLDNLSVNIARAPEQEQVEEQLEKIKKLTKIRTQTLLAQQEKIEAAKRKYREAIEFSRQMQRLHDKHKVAYNAAASLISAQNTYNLLATFSEHLTQVRVKQLESEFIKSYQKLARKEDLQLSARINTKTFDVELIDEHNHTISRKALSAGEKQIYAISILEALGKTSGKKLPIIIDTPLGRLDSKHRDKLIEHYFPDASHQVIILSTDTEIDEAYFNEDCFKDEISHAFEIQFDGRTKSSKLKEGYFWQQNTTAEVN